MKVLVTGGAGFIGSNTVDLLLEKGFEVAVIDNFSTGFKELLNPEVEFFGGSFGDKKILQSALNGVEAVIHFAAFSQVEESTRKEKDYWENNVINSVVLLEEMRKKGIKKFVFSSSSSVYGEPKTVPIKETAELNPISPYGETKKTLEKVLELYSSSFGLKSVSLRYFNAFGPKELHKPETHAVPNFIKAVLREEKIKVFGSGEQVRDFVFVEDLARAHVTALEKIEEFECEVFNLGSGKGFTVKEVIEKIFSAAKKETEIDFLDERKGDPKKLVAEIKKAEELLGWKPETELEEGLEKTLVFFKEEKKNK